jgi:putative membrane protein
MLAAGVALEALEVPIQRGFRLSAAATLVAIAMLTVAQAWYGWATTERMLRRGEPLPSPLAAPVLAAGVVLACVLIAIGYVSNG